MTLTEAYQRRLRAFDAGDVEEFYDPSQARDKEGQWTKMWSGVSAHPDKRVAPKMSAMTLKRLQQSPEHLARQIFDADLGNGFRATIDDDGVENNSSGEYAHVYLNGKILRKDGQQVGYFKRVLYTDDEGKLVAEHQELFLDPQYQGRGLADRFNSHTISQYQKYGVDRIELEASAEVGGYAWARQGFRFRGTDQERGDFLNRQLDRIENSAKNMRVLEDHRKQIRSEVAVLRAAIKAGEDVQPIHIASVGEKYARYTDRDLQHEPPRDYETWPGKRVLIGNTWNGVYYFDANVAVTAAATSLEHAALRPAFRDETPVLVELAFDPRQPRDKEGQWTVGVQHVANTDNAEAIVRSGFSTNTPKWDRSFGDGVYLAQAGDEKSAKFYARQGGREWRTSKVIEGTVSLSNPLHVEARTHSDFRAAVVEALGGVEAVRAMAQAKYDHTVAVTKRIVAEEVGIDHGVPLDRPEKVNWYHIDQAADHPDTIWVSKKVEAAQERIHQRVEEETGQSIGENAFWRELATNTEAIAKRGTATSSDNYHHYSRLLGNLARDNGYDGIVINTNRWGGVGGTQIVAFETGDIRVTGARPYAKPKSVTAAAEAHLSPGKDHEIVIHDPSALRVTEIVHQNKAVTAALEFVFNPRQPRDKEGQWTRTLYRGEGSHDKPSFYPKVGPAAALTGAWWTDDQAKAKNYAAGGIVYKVKVMEGEYEPRGGRGNYVILDPAVRARRTKVSAENKAVTAALRLTRPDEEE